MNTVRNTWGQKCENINQTIIFEKCIDILLCYINSV